MQNCSGETLSKPWVQSMAAKKTKLIKFIIRHTHTNHRKKWFIMKFHCATNTKEN